MNQICLQSERGLKATGVIVPCDDSPVHAPLFPVMKTRDKNIVEALQAVTMLLVHIITLEKTSFTNKLKLALQTAPT